VTNVSRPCAFAGEAAQQLEQQMQQEVELLSQAVNNTPDDVKTRPGEGLGVPSPGFKHLGQMEVLVSYRKHTACWSE